MSITKQEKICNKIKMGYQTIKGVKFKFKNSNKGATGLVDFDTQKKMTNKLFSDDFFSDNLSRTQRMISAAVRRECNKVKSEEWTAPKWIECKGKRRHQSSVKDSCYKVLHDLATKELESTAFILRLLAKSMIDITKTDAQIKKGIDGKEITLIYNGKNDFSGLTGKWKNDINYFSIETQEETTPRLVMAFGPSSAGKTFSGKMIMNMIRESFIKKNQTFPTKFLSIDGGLYREESFVYQQILKVLLEYNNIIGFTDLVSASAWREHWDGTLFHAGEAKKEIAKWLKKNKKKISLYIPETLGFCGPKGCSAKYKKYIEATGDKNWIGLVIWMHQNNTNLKAKKQFGKWKNMCDYPKGRKCKGTYPSGIGREVGEGKKYSSDSWLRSMKNGIKEMKKAGGGRIDFHNSGSRDNKSTIFEYPLDNGKYIFEELYVEQQKKMIYKRGVKTKNKRKKKTKKNKKTKKASLAFLDRAPYPIIIKVPQLAKGRISGTLYGNRTKKKSKKTATKKKTKLIKTKKKRTKRTRGARV